jgi:hypothetical protein
MTSVGDMPKVEKTVSASCSIIRQLDCRSRCAASASVALVAVHQRKVAMELTQFLDR